MSIFDNRPWSMDPQYMTESQIIVQNNVMDYNINNPNSDFNIDKRKNIDSSKKQLVDLLSPYFMEIDFTNEVTFRELIDRFQLHLRIKRSTPLKRKVPSELLPYISLLIEKYNKWKNIQYDQWYHN